MDMWKGVFAPFRKHHGGDTESHVQLTDWSTTTDPDGSKNLIVTFNMIRNPPDGRLYTAEMELTEEEAAGLNDKEVRHLVAEQLELPESKRTWHPVGSQPQM